MKKLNFTFKPQSNENRISIYVDNVDTALIIKLDMIKNIIETHGKESLLVISDYYAKDIRSVIPIDEDEENSVRNAILQYIEEHLAL